MGSIMQRPAVLTGCIKDTFYILLLEKICCKEIEQDHTFLRGDFLTIMVNGAFEYKCLLIDKGNVSTEGENVVSGKFSST